MTKKAKPTWRDLYNFIQEQVDKEGDSFLDNLIYFEMQSPETVNSSFDTIEDSEGWKYCEPAWMCLGKANVMSTRFPKKKIVTLNINF